MKILILGGNGLVGSSLNRVLRNNKNITELFASTRKDADLFDLTETKSLIHDFEPDILVNAAAKVGGIYANNTKRVEFILENLKINMNIIESLKKFPKTNFRI